MTFGCIALLTVILGLVSYHALDNISRQWNDYSSISKQKDDAINEGLESLSEGVQHFKNYVLRAKDYDQRFLTEMDKINAALGRFEKLGPIGAGEKAAIDKVHVGVAAYKDAIKKAVDMKTKGAGIEEIDSTIKGADRAIKEALKEMQTVTEEEIKATGIAVSVQITRGQGVAAIGGVVTVMLTVMLAWVTTRSITVPIAQAVKVTRIVASGDLTQKIDASASDETGDLLRALRDMNANLAGIVSNVRTGAESIKVSSTEIAAGNQDLSSRTEQQASSLEETASSMEELTSTVKQNADNARQANQLAVSASAVAVKGGAVVSEVVGTMSAINDSAKKIVDIIGVIDGIAFQTNILALNAAVEAARAGEQGRGFAVVAAEVRNLAQRSAAAAKEIKTLIGDSVEKVDAGTALVDQAGTTMDEVVASVRRVTDIISEIAAASDEQRAGIEQVNQAITQMDQVTQQNAALVEEAAAASEAMQEQAGKLAQVVSVFKLDGMQGAA
jgi:methyl-accepting chemotaxis protein